MKNNKPVWTFEVPTTLTLAEIASVLYEVKEGNFSADNLPFILHGKSACKIHKEGSRFLIHFHDGHKEYPTIDKANHKVSIQGEWRYKGVYSFHAQGAQTIARLQAFNVAKNYRWAASLMILPEKSTHKKAFQKFMDELEDEVAERRK